MRSSSRPDWASTDEGHRTFDWHENLWMWFQTSCRNTFIQLWVQRGSADGVMLCCCTSPDEVMKLISWLILLMTLHVSWFMVLVPAVPIGFNIFQTMFWCLFADLKFSGPFIYSLHTCMFCRHHLFSLGGYYSSALCCLYTESLSRPIISLKKQTKPRFNILLYMDLLSTHIWIQARSS